MRSERNTINDNVQAAGSDLDAQIKAELVRRRAQQLQKDTTSLWRNLWRNVQDLLAASLDKLQTVGTVFVGRIIPFKPRPSKRGGDFNDTLKEYASNLTQSIAERGEILAEYRDDLSHELRKRGRHMRRTLQQQNRKLQKKLQRQFQQRQKRTFWIAAGFAFGLTLAGIIGYQFLSHRLQQRKEEEAALELPIDAQNGNVMIAALPEAAFVGVTSTKLYYPIEIPLDQLPTENDSPVDAIYFQSEQEATKQGFQPAPSY
jgi:hypothetical protein